MIYGIIYSNACGRNSFKVSSIIPMKDKNPIVVVSGQHHLSALKQYADSLQDKYDMLDKKQMKIINMAKPLMYHVQQHNEYQALQEDLRWVLDNIGQWDMIIYNQDGPHMEWFPAWTTHQGPMVLSSHWEGALNAWSPYNALIVYQPLVTLMFQQPSPQTDSGLKLSGGHRQARENKEHGITRVNVKNIKDKYTLSIDNPLYTPSNMDGIYHINLSYEEGTFYHSHLLVLVRKDSTYTISQIKHWFGCWSFTARPECPELVLDCKLLAAFSYGGSLHHWYHIANFQQGTITPGQNVLSWFLTVSANVQQGTITPGQNVLSWSFTVSLQYWYHNANVQQGAITPGQKFYS
ncbi:hypothetical protein EV424DRAFT_1349200 [Suillus variegatus]|nr:hypothetical protein EV424DRAFT_1349200 [Suillus variegatus]